MKNGYFLLSLLLGVFFWTGCTSKPPMPSKEEILNQIKIAPETRDFYFGMSVGSRLDDYNYELKMTPRKALIKDGILLPDGIWSSKLNPKHNDKFLEVGASRAKYVYGIPHVDDISFVSAGPAGYDEFRYMIATVSYRYEITDWAKQLNKYTNPCSDYTFGHNATFLLEYKKSNRYTHYWKCVKELNYR